MRPDCATTRCRRLRSESGQSLVEFAIVAILLFQLVFGIMDFGRVLFAQLTLQHAIREAGRFAVTGNKLPDPVDPNRTLSRVDSIKEVARRTAVGLDVSNIDISSPNGSGNAGGPGQNVTISMQQSLRLITPIVAQFFPNGQYSFTLRTTFKNEPFPPSQTI